MRSAQLHQFAGAPLRLCHLPCNHHSVVDFLMPCLRCPFHIVELALRGIQTPPPLKGRYKPGMPAPEASA